MSKGVCTDCVYFCVKDEIAYCTEKECFLLLNCGCNDDFKKVESND